MTRLLCKCAAIMCDSYDKGVTVRWQSYDRLEATRLSGWLS